MMNFDINKPKFFGRRQGRTIHKAKSFLLESFLPQILIDSHHKLSLSELFPSNMNEYCLEIGFGDGEHLASIAMDNPQTGFIGVEVFKNGIANLLSLITGIKEGNAQNLQKEITLTPKRPDNIRIYNDDMRLLFDKIPDSSLNKIYLLFPDPWPKNRHAERRFINKTNLQQMARILKKGGILQIATDHPVYKRWTLETLHECHDFRWTAKSSDDWRNPPADWHETKYQRKAICEGRRPIFFEYERI